MKILAINLSDIQGGAARAAYRIHQCLRQQGIDSSMLVNVALSGDWTVQGPTVKWDKFATRFRPHAGAMAWRLLRTSNLSLHSPAILPSYWPDRLNKSDADVVHLHWICGEMLSISDIGRLRKPLVWTLHDMWAFCGAEHYTEDFRWRDGYRKSNRPDYEHGFDLNCWTWERKRKYWRRPMHIVTPSNWLADCVRESALMSDWTVSVVPYFIDSNVWQPVDKMVARKILGLPQDAPLLLFGAMGGISDPRKGFDLLQNALDHLRGEFRGMELVIFGQLTPKFPLDLGFPTHYMGHLYDDISLSLLYSAADAYVLPSRQDNLPNTGIEAHACGTPVIGFNIGGVPDIVSHLKTGYVAKAFDPVDLAEGIRWVLTDLARNLQLRKSARIRACSEWSSDVVTKGYYQAYSSAISSQYF